MLVGNKCDLPDRKITEQEGKELASFNNMRFIEMSAKKGVNVMEAFQCLSNDIINRIPSYKKKVVTPHGPNTLNIQKKKAKPKCCQ